MEATEQASAVRQDSDAQRGIDVWLNFSLIAMILVVTAWWSSYRRRTEVSIPLISPRYLELAQMYGRIEVEFSRRGTLFPVALTRPTFSVRQYYITPTSDLGRLPFFRFYSIGYLVPGAGVTTAPWPGFHLVVPHALLLIFATIYPAVQLCRMPLSLRRTIASDTRPHHSTSG